jgi:hypothetical protein
MRAKIFRCYCAFLSVVCGVAGLVVAQAHAADVIGASSVETGAVFLEALSLFFVIALSVVRVPAATKR